MEPMTEVLVYNIQGELVVAGQTVVGKHEEPQIYEFIQLGFGSLAISSS